MAGLQQPRPQSVATVAELAYELRLLKIHVGDPSVRDLSRTAARAGTVLPHSTAQDALSGKRGLPRLATVLALVSALGVADTGPWRDAWRRAGQHHRGLDGRPERPAGLVADRRHPAGEPPAPRAVPARIAVVNAARGAALVESLPLEVVVEQLAEMSEPDAARRLELVVPGRAAEVLSEMDDGRAARILDLLRLDLAAGVVAEMRPSAAARLLEGLPGRNRSAVLARLAPRIAAGVRAELA
ncbi:hypothetical protein Asp14428_25920 [Actinoplanes sp. NBRC 14428]|uniref:MgtE-like protein n=1 Tax=Pseudosporangium ferrugineum TaxID=439699 RepID=A0A2T0S9N9_9ACTN|nr:hypothetical protein [Pseudosporangium ferrugineum]PRY30139.1 MgtE-like protein [Pseudosporangium ferrugineum]BCJ51117.1 hypothetical protein Asp14428_25920 [Actinoplanes sp. NBRC 14428]